MDTNGGVFGCIAGKLGLNASNGGAGSVTTLGKALVTVNIGVSILDLVSDDCEGTWTTIGSDCPGFAILYVCAFVHD